MKDLSKLLVIKELITSLQLLKNNAFWLVIASIIDAVFFFAYAFITTPVSDKVIEHAVLIANKLSTIMAQQEIPTGILGHLIGPELGRTTGKLLILIGLLFIVMYAVYTAFQATSWWMTTKIAQQKWTYKQYFIGFAKINLIWMTGYALYKILDTIFGLRNVLIQKLAPGTPNIAGNILYILFILLALTALTSYTTLKTKTIYKTPIKITIPLLIISASIYLTTQFILNNISKLSVDAALIAGLILLFPVIILLKVYATRVLNNVHTRN